MWIKYDNRARRDGSAQRGGGRGLILGVGEGERARGGGLHSSRCQECVVGHLWVYVYGEMCVYFFFVGRV